MSINYHTKNINLQAYLYLFFILFVFLRCDTASDRQVYQIEKELVVDSAGVVTAHPLASQVGIDILKDGGNAIDAAIAVQFALQVVYPRAGNIGGGGFMVYRSAEGNIAALDFREKAPQLASKDMFLDKDGNVNNDLARNGHLSVGVPGSVAGMYEAFQKYSQLKDWSALVEPAYRLAKEGFRLTENEASKLNDTQSSFEAYNTSPNVFINKKEFKTGDLFIQEDLAATLDAIRKEGKDGFYKGKVAEAIVQEMKRGKGIITLDDLKNYKAVWRKPITTQYQDYEIISMPPPSSGGIALAQLFELVENFPLQNWGFQSPRSVHLMVEAERRVYADRAKHLGDTDFFPVPITDLMDANYLQKRAKSIDLERASPSDSIQAGVLSYESEETTHFSIVDAYGNAVSITTTLNSNYGSKVVVGGAGFFLNNEMDDFSSKPGVPNQFGLVGAEANAIEPDKRMLSSMTPTIVTKNDSLYMVVGTPGGATIITSVFQVIINVIAFDMNLSEAVQAPRFHHQWLPDKIQTEPDALSPNTRKELETLGHTIENRGSIGRVDAIMITPSGKVFCAADKRGDDDAAGY